MIDNNLLHLVFLHGAGCTHNDLKKIFLIENPPDFSEVWKEIMDNTIDLNITPERYKKIQEKSKNIEEAKIEKLLNEKSIQIITWHDERYPERLKTIGHAPYFLYVRWMLRWDTTLVWVVWSRKSTPYAKKILEKIIPELTSSGLGIISWGAAGVDTLGHEITLRENGYTISVLGTGIDRAYPANNKPLFESILTHEWAIISHFPLGTGPEVYNFPIRNEIVAAMSHGILIPEAALSSGTLITAQLALEHWRDVFAVPWDIDRVTSEGTNMLISSGQAKCVRCAWDILEEYFDLSSIWNGMTPIIKITPVFTDEKEKIIYGAIEKWISRVDELASDTNLEMSDLLITLSMLEIWWHITLDEMWRYHTS